jgi:hypothetical protein
MQPMHWRWPSVTSTIRAFEKKFGVRPDKQKEELMKLPLSPLSLVLVLVCLVSADAQKRKAPTRDSGIVIDETLAVLRTKPSLFAGPIHRMRRGRRVQVLGSVENDGVKFYKVAVSSAHFGWIQSDAILGRLQRDEERLARFVLAADGFDQTELASIFLAVYPASRLRPAILLLYGDLLEAAAMKLSRDAGSRLNRRSMAASGAPEHSFYLNFRMLDRYRRLGVVFLFNSKTRTFHYNGASWLEIVRKFPAASESGEARKRLDSLKEKLQRPGVASN